MITRQHLLHLLLNKYHDGRYLNGHPEIAEWIDSEWPPACYIELMADELGNVTYNNVRVWSSKDEYEKHKTETTEQAREFYRKYSEPAVRVPQERHPLEDELEALCKTATSAHDFAKIVSVKGQLRKLGIQPNQKQTSIRKLSGL